MQARSLALVGIGLGVVALGWLWVLQSRGAPDLAAVPSGGQDHRVYLLASDHAGTCTVDWVLPSPVRPLPGDRVIWLIQNDCDTPIRLTDFEQRQPANKILDPLDDIPPGRRREVPAHQSGEIRTRVKRNVEDGLYRYWIRTNNREAFLAICDMPPCPWDP